MNELLNKIHEYLINKGADINDLLNLDKSSVNLAMEIMEYAHNDQYRVNNEEYAYHPKRVMENYRKLIGILLEDNKGIDPEFFELAYGIPYIGVQEVCLLHDVIEDTNITIEELIDIYIEQGLGDYFDLYIKQPLINVTHIKGIDYEAYIDICMSHPTSALVKMLDLVDNCNVLNLDKLDLNNFERTIRYMFYINKINRNYKFIEKVHAYKEAFNKTN